MTKKPYKSNLFLFIRDFGDAVGGVCIGYGIEKPTVERAGWIFFGIALILIAVYQRFYTSNNKQYICKNEVENMVFR